MFAAQSRLLQSADGHVFERHRIKMKKHIATDQTINCDIKHLYNILNFLQIYV